MLPKINWFKLIEKFDSILGTGTSAANFEYLCNYMWALNKYGGNLWYVLSWLPYTII